jgi:hypothetical protein
VILTAKDLEDIETIIWKYPKLAPRYSARENKFVKKSRIDAMQKPRRYQTGHSD